MVVDAKVEQDSLLNLSEGSVSVMINDVLQFPSL